MSYPFTQKDQKDEIKNESVPKKEKEETKPQTFVIKTEIDAKINERVQTQPKTLDEIRAKDIVFADGAGKHSLTLPKVIKEALDKERMTPYWINKNMKAIDHALSPDRGWTLFNRVYFPDVPAYCFTANGTVERGDCILGFMPVKNAERLRRHPGEVSQERIKDLPINRYEKQRGDEKLGFYKPAYTAEPEGEMAKREAGLFAQPDLPTETAE